MGNLLSLLKRSSAQFIRPIHAERRDAPKPNRGFADVPVSAIDGVPNEWHSVHLTSLARGGAGQLTSKPLLSPEGRITPGCTGLWSDAQAQAFAPIVAGIEKADAVAGIQIGHAGHKASAKPALGRGQSYRRGRSARLGDHRTLCHCIRRRSVEGATGNQPDSFDRSWGTAVVGVMDKIKALGVHRHPVISSTTAFA